MQINENLEIVRRNIAHAASGAGRRPEDVTLIAVTKTVGVDEIKSAIDSGICDIGESRVRDSLKKYPSIPAGVVWHFIGHLQTNKVKEVVKIFDVIHSVDSVRLASCISERAVEAGKVVDVLAEINISGEVSKYGIKEDAAQDALTEMSCFQNIRLIGLMTMAPASDDPESARPVFRRLREIKDRMNSLGADNLNLKHLSMGMSQDYAVAVQEGATFVRVGTALFR